VGKGWEKTKGTAHSAVSQTVFPAGSIKQTRYFLRHLLFIAWDIPAISLNSWPLNFSRWRVILAGFDGYTP